MHNGLFFIVALTETESITGCTTSSRESQREEITLYQSVGGCFQCLYHAYLRSLSGVLESCSAPNMSGNRHRTNTAGRKR